MDIEQDSSCSSGFVAPNVFFVTCNCWRIWLLRVAIDKH